MTTTLDELERLHAAATEAKPADRRGPYVHLGGRDFRCGKQGDRSGAYTAADAAAIVAIHNAFPAGVGVSPAKWGIEA